jgi:UDP-N-acetylmuramoylalanine--D-glutamate ligase
MDLIVRHQRIRSSEPELRAARKNGIPIESELSVFLRVCTAPVIGVTGTRGKSTSTALLHHILQTSKRWRKVWLGGNILVSPLMFLDEIKPQDIVVLEMSSFQLEGLGEAGRSPQTAVVTNLMRDHLNTYASMEEYVDAKTQIFRHQQPQDLAILPNGKEFDEMAAEAPGNVYRWGKAGSAEERIVGSVKMNIRGEHNVHNAEAATAVALALGVKVLVVKAGLRTFVGLENREEIVAMKGGITFVNDTTATTPDATMAAIDVFANATKNTKTASGTTHLIFGGADKELEFDQVAERLHRANNVHVYLLPGTAYEKIVNAFTASHVSFMDVNDLREAFRIFKTDVKRGDTVLLSPGCASFGLFKNEFDRGETFKALVKTYGR